MARVKTFVDGGSITPGDLDLIQDDYETAFSIYKLLRVQAATVGSAGAFPLGTYLFSDDGVSGTATTPVGASTIGRLMYLDPADHFASPRSLKLRVRVSYVVNAVAPATTLTIGLYPVASYSGTASNPPAVASIGSVVAGSTASIATPAANASGSVVGSDFTLASAGVYCLGVAIPAPFATGAVLTVSAALQLRQV